MDDIQWHLLKMALFIAGFFAVMVTLHLVLCREWVKSDLAARGSVPFSIRWSWIGPGIGARFLHYGTFFRVHYRDLLGGIHEAWCLVPRYTWREVRWIEDEVVLIEPFREH